eukprot:m.90474 g.90474  ORF g.90474 m.90474 type:complete len:306 (-) comp8850_c1_seq25:2563-3480(-)
MMKKAKKYFCACGGDDDSNGNSNSSVGDDGVLDKDDGASNSQDKISLREKVVRLSPEKFKRRASHEKGTTLGLKSKKRKTKIANRICAGVAEEDALQLKLPDILCDKLLVLIVGINPGVWSSAKGRHYGGPGNHFWPCLNASGILPQGTQFSCENDISCVNHGIGFANMVARTTRGMADLSRTEIEGGTSNIKRIAAIYKPKIICFNGKGIYQIFSGNSKCNYGVQDMVVAVGSVQFLLWYFSIFNLSSTLHHVLFALLCFGFFLREAKCLSCHQQARVVLLFQGFIRTLCFKTRQPFLLNCIIT